jgi:predicted short-subunit dehydrogenase-like oxidoreductase (DUF2520 family)
MLTLNIIGGGKVAKTLGFLLATHPCYVINDILCRRQQASDQACEFITSGRPITNYKDLRASDVYLLAVTDDQIVNVAQQLQAIQILKPGDIVFHCSGALSSDILQPLKASGAHIASLHPIKSFGNPCDNIHNFQNTVCTVEGDQSACEHLITVFSQIGAKVYSISSNHKMLYHSSLVLSCNYLTTLIDASLQLLEKSGLSRDIGFEMLEPLILGTLHQVKSLGTAQALTGPISRGDSALVKKQLDCLNLDDESLGNLYKVLGKLTLELAIKRKTLSEAEILNLENSLS